MARKDYLSDPYQLERFVEAQKPVWPQVQRELAAGEKRSHWMWFVFPQIRGLGSSFMAQRFAISGLKEARAYLEHPVLGSRLRECTGLVNAVQSRPVKEIFGYLDDLKFHSSMTLFAEAAASGGMATEMFREALARYFGGTFDEGTLAQLRA